VLAHDGGAAVAAARPAPAGDGSGERPLVLLSPPAITYSVPTGDCAHDRFDPSGLDDQRLDADASMSDTTAQMLFFREVLRAAADPDVEAGSTRRPFRCSSGQVAAGVPAGRGAAARSSVEQRAAVGFVNAIQVSESFFHDAEWCGRSRFALD
jgi:hypothetical protein